MKRDRRQRHLRILELISTRSIHTQDELVDALCQDGWEVTQSSVSRDIGALRLVKVDGIYQRPGVVEERPPDHDLTRITESVLSLDLAGDALVILHTPPGEANRAGIALDRLAWPEVLGTIAGDDTIFVAVRDRASRDRLVERFADLVPHV